jgi:hypothetical protein
MRRALIVFAIVAGTAVPALLAAARAFGCCALPFHLCRLAAMHGAAPQQQPASPVHAPKTLRVDVRIVPLAGLTMPPAHGVTLPPPRAAAYRSFISLGAVRCDRDVGLHALLAVFLI